MGLCKRHKQDRARECAYLRQVILKISGVT